jgi:imidazolonepropionase-like amidohydrolase
MRFINYVVCTFLGISIACSCAQAQSTSGVRVFEGARLIDGTGKPAIENSVIVVEGGKVAAAGVAGSVAIPSGATVEDVHGKTIMPLLVVLISHVGLTGKVGEKPQYIVYSEEIVHYELELNLSYGIGALVSLGQDQDFVYKLRADQRAGNLPGTRFFTAGRGLGVKNAYPDPTYPNGVDQYRPLTPEEGRADMDELAQHRPDFVKIWVDTNFGTLPKMQPPMFRAIIDEAHKQHCRVIAHEYALSDSKALVDAGVDGFAHSIRDEPVDDAIIDAMKDHGTFLIPSLAREESKLVYADGPKYLDDPFFQAGLDVGVLETLKSAKFKEDFVHTPYYLRNHDVLVKDFALAKSNLKRLYDAGVSIGFGSDSGMGAETLRFDGFHDHRELQLMVDAGLTPMQAITVATGGSAKILGGPDVDFGVLLPGKQADFMVLDANPLEDIHNTETISSIWQAGIRVRAITDGIKN